MAELKYINPASLPDTRLYGFSQIVKVQEGSIVYISGQVGWDENYIIVSDELGEQCARALYNLDRCLEALECDVRNIAKLTIYIVDYDQEAYSDRVSPLIKSFVRKGYEPALTLLGVQQLARPDFKIEIEACIVK